MNRSVSLQMAALALAALHFMGVVQSATAQDLQRPTKVIQTPLGNLLIAEVGTAAAAPNTGRVSIVDEDGNRRTLIEGLPSSPKNAANTPAGPSGLFLDGRTLYLAIGEGNPTIPGPFPRTEIPNPDVSSPIFSSVLSVHFSAAVEKTTTGVSLTLADHFALKNGSQLVKHDQSGGKVTIKLIVDFPDYIPEPLPILATNVRHSHPYGVVADNHHLYVCDGGINAVRKVDIQSGESTVLVSFPTTPNPTPVGPRMVENVATSIRWDGDKLLVTLLSGFPFVAGLSQVVTVDPGTGAYSTLIGGLASAIDVIPLRGCHSSGGYLTLEYSQAHLAGGPGRLQVFDSSGNSTAVISSVLISPSAMVYDRRNGKIVVAQINPGNLVAFPFPD